MSEIEDIKIKYTVDDDDLKRSIQSLQSLTQGERDLVAQMRQVNAAAAQTGNTITKEAKEGTAATKGLADQFKRQGDEADKAYQRIKNGSSSARQELGGMGKIANSLGSAIAGAFAIDQVIGFATKVVDVTAQFQKLQAVLSTALGSESDAQVAFAQIQDFAARTNFSVLELTDSYVKLVNQGFKPTTKELENLADLANSTGKGFDQLTEAVLDASNSFEFERLKEFGISAKQSGDQVALTFKGVTTTLDKSAESIRKYVVGLGDLQGVSGSTAAISETLGGKISNLGDTFDSLFNTIGTRGESVISNFIGLVNTGIQALNRLIQSESQRREAGVLKDLAKQAEETRERVEALTASNIKLGQQETEARRNALEQITEETEELLEVRQRELDLLKEKAKDTADREAFDKLRDQVQTAEDGLRVDQERLKALKALNLEYFAPIKPVELTTAQIKKHNQELEKQKKLLEDMRKAYQATLQDAEGSNPLMELVRDYEEAAKTISRNGVSLGYSKEQIAADLKTVTDFFKGRFRAAQDSKEAIARLGDDEVALLRERLKELNAAYQQALGENNQALAKSLETEIFYTEKAYDRALTARLTKFAAAGDKQIDKVKEQAEQEIKANEEKNKRKEQQEAEHRAKIAAIVEESVRFLGELGNAAFEIGANRRAAELDDLSAQQDAELKLVGDNKQAKEFINNEYANKEKQLKIKQAQADKTQALFNIGISTAMAVAKANPVIPLMAFAAATGLLQAAVVASKPLPKFKDGVLDLKGPGTTTSDSIHAMLSRGESVMTAEETRKFFPTLKAIRGGNVDADLLNHAAKGIDMDLLAKARGRIDMNLLTSVARMDHKGIAPAGRHPGAATASQLMDVLSKGLEGLRAEIKNMPVSSVQMDEKGFKKFIRRRDSITEILNNQYPD